MEIGLLLLRLLLASIFGVAGIAKLFDPAGSEKAFGDFGLPKVIAGPMVYILPAAELAIAGMLLFVSTSWFGAIGRRVFLWFLRSECSIRWQRATLPIAIVLARSTANRSGRQAFCEMWHFLSCRRFSFYKVAPLRD